MVRTIVGVMGAGDNATARDIESGRQLGSLIAMRGWTLLTGGRNVGVMHAASRGAKECGGLVIGILPASDTQQMSEFVDIPIVTGMGSARNNINVLSSKVIIACGMGAGTASEVALALKANRPVIILLTAESENDSRGSGHETALSSDAASFFSSISPSLVTIVHSPEDAVDAVLTLIESEIEGEWKRPTRPSRT